ncbi:hypothetical protein BC940DRAFT_297130 [Gongronella butleri]|nr:hypothetical protein BC940DRAFT_297130 [Gongronella butleri]
MAHTVHELDLSHNDDTVTSTQSHYYSHSVHTAYGYQEARQGRGALFSRVKDGLFRLVGKRSKSLVHSIRPKRPTSPEINGHDNLPGSTPPASRHHPILNDVQSSQHVGQQQEQQMWQKQPQGVQKMSSIRSRASMSSLGRHCDYSRGPNDGDAAAAVGPTLSGANNAVEESGDLQLYGEKYGKDDDFERARYRQQQQVRRSSTTSLHPPASILVKPSKHRHTASLQHDKTTSSSLLSSGVYNSSLYYHHHSSSASSSILTTGSAISVTASHHQLPPMPLNSSSTSAHRPVHYGHTRHYSQLSSSNITVNSEDLTAKEFADLAGIRILAETDDCDDELDQQHGTPSSPATTATAPCTTSSTTASSQSNHALITAFQQHPPPSRPPLGIQPVSSSSSSSVTTPVHDDVHHWSILSTSSQQSGGVRIWDQSFWRRPSVDETNAKSPPPPPILTTPPLNTSVSPTGIATLTTPTVEIEEPRLTAANAGPMASFHASSLPPPPNVLQQQQQQRLLPPFPQNNGNMRAPLRKHRSAMLQHRATLSLPPPIPSTSAAGHIKMRVQHTKSKSTTTCDLPIVHELRRIQSLSNDKKISHDQQVIRKGRFEIQLGTAADPASSSS